MIRERLIAALVTTLVALCLIIWPLSVILSDATGFVVVVATLILGATLGAGWREIYVNAMRFQHFLKTSGEEEEDEPKEPPDKPPIKKETIHPPVGTVGFSKRDEKKEVGPEPDGDV